MLFGKNSVKFQLWSSFVYHIISTQNDGCPRSHWSSSLNLTTSIVLRHTHTVSPHLIAACTTGVACCQQLQTDTILECWCLVVSSWKLFEMEFDKWNGIETSWTWWLTFLRCQIQLVWQKPFNVWSLAAVKLKMYLPSSGMSGWEDTQSDTFLRVVSDGGFIFLSNLRCIRRKSSWCPKFAVVVIGRNFFPMPHAPVLSQFRFPL